VEYRLRWCWCVINTFIWGLASTFNYVYGHGRALLPWLRVPCWFFLQFEVEKLLAWPGIKPTTIITVLTVKGLWPFGHCNPMNILGFNQPGLIYSGKDDTYPSGQLISLSGNFLRGCASIWDLFWHPSQVHYCYN